MVNKSQTDQPDNNLRDINLMVLGLEETLGIIWWMPSLNNLVNPVSQRMHFTQRFTLSNWKRQAETSYFLPPTTVFSVSNFWDQELENGGMSSEEGMEQWGEKEILL